MVDDKPKCEYLFEVETSQLVRNVLKKMQLFFQRNIIKQPIFIDKEKRN